MQNENRFCVYVHRNKLTNEVFYVGSGTGQRPYQLTNRSKTWNAYVALNGFFTEILCKDLHLVDARDMEGLLIDMSTGLLNINKPVSGAIEITQSMLDQVYYDETSPTGLRWVSNRKLGIKANDPAGTMERRNNTNHRCRVVLDYKSVPAHRIIYAIHYGSVSSSMLIDHIDGNPHNNRILNLREVTHATNSRNVQNKTSNKSGVVGVLFKTNADGYTYWSATWRENFKSRTRSFMIEKYGNDEAFKLACDFRKAKIEELNKLGAGYTERHSEI